MTPALEIRIIAYAVLAIVLLGGAGWAGHHFTALHYEALIARDKLSQDRALQDAQQRVIAVQAAQDSARQQAEKQYADLKSNYDGLSQRLVASVRAFTDTIRSGAVPSVSPATAGTHAASPGPGSAGAIADAAGAASQGCLRDAAALASLQTWIRSITGDQK